MNFKLGKLAAQSDYRTLNLAHVFSTELPPIPESYIFDRAHKGIPLRMFANDEYGCCVISGRAHQTLRFEKVEQDAIIKITDDEVVKEYFRETGGPDSGLVMLSSLNAWRKGWKVGGRTFTIDAFGRIDKRSPSNIKAAIYLLGGLQIGLWLPLSAQDQIGNVWTMVSGSRGRPGTWGGHCVHIIGYETTAKGLRLICVTWGALQSMTYEFFLSCCDEAYGVVDSLDTWREKPGIDPVKLSRYLNVLKYANGK